MAEQLASLAMSWYAPRPQTDRSFVERIQRLTAVESSLGMAVTVCSAKVHAGMAYFKRAM